MKVKLNMQTIRTALIVLVAILVLCAAFQGLRRWEQKHYKLDYADSDEEEFTNPYEGEDQSMIYRDGKWYVLNDRIETVLLLGLDKYEESVAGDSDSYINHQQADFCLLLLMDHEKKECTAIHINRDTMMDIHIFGVNGKDMGTAYEQLALAHTYGSGGTDSCENTAQAVSDFLYGVPIDHYISLTMDAVAEVNDRVGGVTVTVMDDFTMSDETMAEGAAVTLSGEQALLYVQARASLENSTNMRRMERQRQYLQGLSRQAQSRLGSDDGLLLDTVLAVSPYMVSDCTAEQLSQIASCVLEYSDEGIQAVEGEAIKGEQYMEFYADEEALQTMVLELFYEETVAEE